MTLHHRRLCPIAGFCLVCALVAGAPALADSGSCPPGLAKKSPACVPPGLAKNAYRGVDVGDNIRDRDRHLIRYPDRYGLHPLRDGERYYVVDGNILRVDEQTFEVLDFIRATAELLD